MFLSILSMLMAVAAVDVFNPRVPLILDREYNIVSEIVIPASKPAMVGGEVEVSLEGLPLDALNDIRLVYTGTISPVLSRTKSNVMKYHFNIWGAGQDDWCKPGSISVETLLEGKELRRAAGKGARKGSFTVKLPFDRPLVKGENHFYVSLNVASAKVGLADTFSCKVLSVRLDGNKATLQQHGETVGRRYGIALRNHGDDGVDTYRIPGLASRGRNELVAVYDIRWDSYSDLQADIDIGFQKSLDGGKTWSKMAVALDMGEWGGLPKDQNGTGDPCVLVDSRTGNIFVFALWAHGLEGSWSIFSSGQGLAPSDVAQFVMVKSTDGGKTWSQPVNLTPLLKDYYWSTIFQGPGCGITMADGTLVVPVQIWDKDKVPSCAIIYSKDSGETWTLSNIAATHVGEDQVAEIAPGVLMLNMRNHGTQDRQRKVYVSSDLGKTWTEHVSSNTLDEPLCQASLLRAGELLLFANTASTTARNNFTVRASTDGGKTWPGSLLLDEEKGWGYSCMAMIDPETVGILYEGSTSQLVFQAVRTADILGAGR